MERRYNIEIEVVTEEDIFRFLQGLEVLLDSTVYYSDYNINYTSEELN